MAVVNTFHLLLGTTSPKDVFYSFFHTDPRVFQYATPSEVKGSFITNFRAKICGIG